MKFVFYNKKNEEVEICSPDLYSARLQLEKVVRNPSEYKPDLFMALQELLKEIKKSLEEYKSTRTKDARDRAYMLNGFITSIILEIDREKDEAI